MCNHGLTQLVGEPTRGNSIPDVSLCSDVLSCDDVTVLPPIANSDHDLSSSKLLISLSQTVNGGNRGDQPNFSKADWVGLSSYPSSINWLVEMADCLTINDYWDNFVKGATNPNIQREKPIRRDSEPWHAARLEGAKPR